MSDAYGGPGAPSGDERRPAPYPQAYPHPYPQASYGVPPAGATPPGQYPYGQQPYGPYAPHLYGRPGFGPPGFVRHPDARPATVLAAGIVTIVLSGLAVLVLGIILLVGIALQATIAEELDGETLWGGWSTGAALALGTALLLLWAIAAIFLASFALRRSARARITLVVSSGLTIAVSLFLVISGGLLAVLPLMGAIAVIVLLFTGGAGEWYSGRLDEDDYVGGSPTP